MPCPIELRKMSDATPKSHSSKADNPKPRPVTSAWLLPCSLMLQAVTGDDVCALVTCIKHGNTALCQLQFVSIFRY